MMVPLMEMGVRPDHIWPSQAMPVALGFMRSMSDATACKEVLYSWPDISRSSRPGASQGWDGGVRTWSVAGGCIWLASLSLASKPLCFHCLSQHWLICLPAILTTCPSLL